MKIEIPDLTPEECGDIAVTAAEGAIGYWAQIDEYDWKRWLADPEDDSKGNAHVADDFVFYRIAPLSPTETEYDWKHAVEVTPALIRRGFEAGLVKPRDKGGWAVQRLLDVAREDWTGEIDSDAADIIIQFGVYDEVIYG